MKNCLMNMEMRAGYTPECNAIYLLNVYNYLCMRYIYFKAVYRNLLFVYVYIRQLCSWVLYSSYNREREE